MSIVEKQAYFYDNKNNKQYASILINEDRFIGINTFDEDNNPTGYIHVCFHPNNRLFLDTIYCYDQYRRLGIATIISELADYLLKDYTGYIIRGVYKPGQLSTDRENNIERSIEELETSARKFYEKNGYSIIKREDFLNNNENYNYIKESDFNLGEDSSNVIVAKIIQEKEYPFIEEDNIIYHINYIGAFVEDKTIKTYDCLSDGKYIK